MAKAKRRLYIAYGSNLNLEQMAQRCPTAKVVGTAVMKNWRIIFCGVATVEPCHGDSVPVLVWDLQPEDEAALDVYEGWPHLYRKEMLNVRLNDRTVRAMIYIMNSGHHYGHPSSGYYNTIREGYVSAGFDEAILHKAVEKSREAGKSAINQKIKEQILAVRDTGETNMFDTNMVMVIAMREEFYELVNFIHEHKREYATFILTGDENQ